MLKNTAQASATPNTSATAQSKIKSIMLVLSIKCFAVLLDGFLVAYQFDLTSFERMQRRERPTIARWYAHNVLTVVNAINNADALRRRHAHVWFHTCAAALPCATMAIDTASGLSAPSQAWHVMHWRRLPPSGDAGHAISCLSAGA